MILITGIPRNKDNKDLNQLISVITAVCVYKYGNIIHHLGLQLI